MAYSGRNKLTETEKWTSEKQSVHALFNLHLTNVSGIEMSENVGLLIAIGEEGVLQRRLIVTVHLVDIGAPLQQQAETLVCLVAHAQMQRRLSSQCPRVQIRSIGYQVLQVLWTIGCTGL